MAFECKYIACKCSSQVPAYAHLPNLQVGKWVGGQIEKLMGQEEGSLRDFVLECLGKRTSPEALLGELEPIFGELNLTIDANSCNDQKEHRPLVTTPVLCCSTWAALNTTALSSRQH